MVCTLYAIWNDKIELTINQKISTNGATKISSLHYKPGYNLTLSDIDLDIPDSAILFEWQYSGPNQNGTLAYNATSITLTDATQLTAIARKVITINIGVTNAGNFTSYSISVDWIVSNGQLTVGGTTDKPSNGSTITTIEGSTITIKGTGGSYWLFGTHFYETTLTLGSQTVNGGNAKESSVTITSGTDDIDASFVASGY